MLKEKLVDRNNYKLLINSIGMLLAQSRQKAFREVNSILVKTYWEIGKYIVTYEQKSKEKGINFISEPFQIRTGFAVEFEDPFGNRLGITDYSTKN